MKIIYARSKDVSGTPCPVCDKPVIIKHGKSKCKNCGAETDWTEKINKHITIGVN